ncbi:LacI family DNA-binding transcriptional regulator [Microvirga pudoricolor]|uniref:LacI family DNA-binding transcriptional regulator n=1 Tax=Microvirga pudoricolor TaxID=2778729 RepID=UPI001951BC45|nr:LacI family DNA-binding transcriptional regulator [Microvirga pudoricolor]MBM6595202.1 LacI family DNA-binding transcriptional regulator [Microvirga pudoricolor]
MANLKQLAQSLGLSITTVSRALDGYGDVAPATRERVQAAARSMNYQPNSAARSLRRRRPETVAVTLPAEPGHFGPAIFLDMLASCGERLAEDGLDLMLVPTVSRKGEMETYRRLVEGRRADAMIVVRTYRDDERVAFLEARGIPFVAHGRTTRDEGHAFIDGDGEEAFRTATLALGGLGHARIAHIGAPQDLTFAGLRRTGWLRGLSDLGFSERAEVTAFPNEAGGYEATRALLAQPDRPTALLCATDSIAIGALQALKDMGLRPGRDVSVIGHDNISSSAFTDPPLSTMEIADAQVGRQLAEMLLARIGGGDPRDLQRILPVRQVPRATHAAPP